MIFDQRQMHARREKYGTMCEIVYGSINMAKNLGSIIGDVPSAISRQATIYPVFQAIVDGDGHVVCHEVLTRCKLGDSFVNPMTLYADADRNGYAEALFESILNQAMQKADDEPLWVNVSTDLIMRPDFKRIVEEAARRHDYTLGKLNVEITEEPCLEGNEALGRRIYELKIGLGVRITQDDFIPDTDSIDRLRHLPLDFIKTDHQMLIDAKEGVEGKKRLTEFISHCHDRGLPVIVEGVETEDERRLCVEVGADYMQGYHFHRPSVESSRVTRPLPPVERGDYCPHFSWSPIESHRGGASARPSTEEGIPPSLGGLFRASFPHAGAPEPKPRSHTPAPR